MNTILRRSAVRLRWLPAAASLLAITFATAPPALGTDSYTVGKPTRTGRIKLTVVLNRAGVTKDLSVTALVDSSFTVLDKQLAILTAITVAQADTVKFHGYHPGGKIVCEPQNGWRVEGVTVTQDDSWEPHLISLGVPLPYQEAFCSLSGAASGVDVHGQVGAGFVRLTVGGTTITQPTQPGMPAAVVEQMLIGQLNQAGIPARFATPADFAGGYETLPHDSQVIWFPVPDTTGFGEVITDAGLSLDLAAILDGNLGSLSDAPSNVSKPELRLDVYPSLYSREGLNVRYATRSERGRIRLDIFDVAGRSVRSLLEDSPVTSGALSWDGRDDRNASLPVGVYFVRLSTAQGNLVRRVVHVRD